MLSTSTDAVYTLTLYQPLGVFGVRYPDTQQLVFRNSARTGTCAILEKETVTASTCDYCTTTHEGTWTNSCTNCHPAIIINNSGNLRPINVSITGLINYDYRGLPVREHQCYEISPSEPSTNPPARLKIMMTDGSSTVTWDAFAINGHPEPPPLTFATSALVTEESTWKFWAEVHAVQGPNCTVTIYPSITTFGGGTIYQETYLEASIQSCPI